MKASELIQRLTELVAEHGDLPIYAPECGDDYGFTDEADTVEVVAEYKHSYAPMPKRIYIAP